MPANLATRLSTFKCSGSALIPILRRVLSLFFLEGSALVRLPLLRRDPAGL